MMARGWFKLFSSVSVLILAACATTERERAGGELATVVLSAPEAAAPNTSASDTSAPAVFTYELSNREPVDGSLIVLRVQLASSFSKGTARGTFDGVELPFYPVEGKSGYFETIVGIPYNHKPGPAFITVKAGEGDKAQSMAVPFRIVAGDYPSEVLRVDQSKVSPKAKDLIRIRREIAEVKKAYSNSARRKHWHGPFRLPIDSPITSPYGGRRVFNGELKSFHGGLDLKAAEGTPVHAAASGVVVLSKDLFYSGNTVLIDHGFGVVTMYGHLSKLKVSKGRHVRAGDLIGLSGMTGRVTGPHLHWQAYIHKVKVNPIDLTKVMR